LTISNGIATTTKFVALCSHYRLRELKAYRHFQMRHRFTVGKYLFHRLLWVHDAKSLVRTLEAYFGRSIYIERKKIID
jgi:hypothetical protein